MKYDNMVAGNKKKSKKKEDKAIREIRRALEADEEVTVAGLVRETGLSRGFFYNNERVSAELQQARKKQNAEPPSLPKKAIVDVAMSKEIARLKKTIEQKEQVIADLQEKLQNVEKEKADLVVKKIENILY